MSIVSAIRMAGKEDGFERMFRAGLTKESEFHSFGQSSTDFLRPDIRF
jgi:hypothetical protein